MSGIRKILARVNENLFEEVMVIMNRHLKSLGMMIWLIDQKECSLVVCKQVTWILINSIIFLGDSVGILMKEYGLLRVVYT